MSYNKRKELKRCELMMITDYAINTNYSVEKVINFYHNINYNNVTFKRVMDNCKIK